MISRSYKKKKVKIPEDPEKAYGKALKTAMNIIGYKDNSEKTLGDKLSERGYSDETVAEVVRFMKSKGYVDDTRMIMRTARRLATVKLYGKQRIKAELYQKKFNKEALSALDWENEELCDIDFAEICLKLLKKRGGVKDEKTYAFLKRYGHSSSDIRAAYAALSEEEDVMMRDKNGKAFI